MVKTIVNLSPQHTSITLKGLKHSTNLGSYKSTTSGCPNAPSEQSPQVHNYPR